MSTFEEASKCVALPSFVRMSHRRSASCCRVRECVRQQQQQAHPATTGKHARRLGIPIDKGDAVVVCVEHQLSQVGLAVRVPHFYAESTMRVVREGDIAYVRSYDAEANLVCINGSTAMPVMMSLWPSKARCM